MLIVSCDARTDIDVGLTSDELQNIMLDLGCVQAWNLDGGGSTSTIIKGSKLNKNIEPISYNSSINLIKKKDKINKEVDEQEKSKKYNK